MDVVELRQEVASGKVGLDRLVDVIASQQNVIGTLREQIERLKARCEMNPTERLDEAYSEKAEEKRQKQVHGGGASKAESSSQPAGRKPTVDKIERAERVECVFPDGCDPLLCRRSHTRVAWRLENGQAVLIAYEIYRLGNPFGQPSGLPGRGEFGMEILIALACAVYTLGLSLDKACQVPGFFQALKLSKSQADALLNRLSREWEQEFDTLCMLLANSVVVHTDETSWSINSVWAFLTESLTLMFYGVHKDGETLSQILDKSRFGGVIVSDNAAVYQGFTNAQKCWAHLLRKAIKLTLQAPLNTSYRDFADSLLGIYRDDAQRRLTGRTSKTPSGAKRQTIITSVLRSLSKQLDVFNLTTVIAEIRRWHSCGRSGFADLATAAGLNLPPPPEPGQSLLDRIILNVDNASEPA